MELSGKVVSILDEFRTQSGKVKYGFVLETGGQYPQRLPFDVWGDDKWSQMNVSVGSLVNVSFDISGREWNGKYFVSLGAWKVVRTDGQVQPQRQEVEVKSPEPPKEEPKKVQKQTKEDDLPF